MRKLNAGRAPGAAPEHKFHTVSASLQGFAPVPARQPVRWLQVRWFCATRLHEQAGVTSTCSDLPANCKTRTNVKSVKSTSWERPSPLHFKRAVSFQVRGP
ncbi:hypothetical protein C1280_29100 [Gemmata obscuriglobus]|uniref:Uncharacterized protein n=1 Tax=Gemmata obscuriglobus TaxID=114 RepID=A0A2Z3H8B6_9BACT|nr:hypothetical protein C1280_29100 [Gemmata obscuriglobus]